MSFLQRYINKFRDRFQLSWIKGQNRLVYDTIQQVLGLNLTYLSPSALVDLYRVVEKIETSAVEGIFLEAGCALGGSSLVITSSKSTDRRLSIYDVFGQIPAPSALDGSGAQERYQVIQSGRSEGIAGDQYYGYEQDLLGKVMQTFSDFGFPPDENNVNFIQGNFKQTLLISEPVAFAHIDVDWYESVLVCLQRVEPMLAVGGVLVIDDYFYWSGCKKAVDHYFSGREREFQFSSMDALHVRRR